jgi:hypothetical protein
VGSPSRAAARFVSFAFSVIHRFLASPSLLVKRWDHLLIHDALTASILKRRTSA